MTFLKYTSTDKYAYWETATVTYQSNILAHPKGMLEGYLQRHFLKRRATDQAAVFDALGMRTCWKNNTNTTKPIRLSYNSKDILLEFLSEKTVIYRTKYCYLNIVEQIRQLNRPVIPCNPFKIALMNSTGEIRGSDDYCYLESKCGSLTEAGEGNITYI